MKRIEVSRQNEPEPRSSLRAGYAHRLPAFALTSFDIGFIPPMSTASAMLLIGPERGGMVSDVVNCFRQISGAFGVAVFVIFITSTDESVAYRNFAIALVAAAFVLLMSIGFFAGTEQRASTRRLNIG